MGLRFILMLTRDDKTVADAASFAEQALDEGVHHIGFKDIGLPFEQLKTVNSTIQGRGATSYLEVVSLDRNSEMASAKAAIDIGVNVLLGGTHVDAVEPLLRNTNIQYCPFAGHIEGHPSRLIGSVDDIADSARKLAARDGVHGLDLLAYRSDTDVEALMQAVCAATNKPVFMAGSVGGPEQISAVKRAGAAGFTIGTAAVDGNYTSAGTSFGAQVRAIMKDVAQVNNHISDIRPKNLNQSFSSFKETWSPRVAGQINNMQVKLVKLEGEFVWHYHAREDELFFVHRGRLLMKFRDREEVVNEGEFLIVPHGVEHCPVALTDICEVMLLEPGSTVNTGTATNERTVTDLARV